MKLYDERVYRGVEVKTEEGSYWDYFDLRVRAYRLSEDVVECYVIVQDYEDYVGPPEYRKPPKHRVIRKAYFNKEDSDIIRKAISIVDGFKAPDVPAKSS